MEVLFGVALVFSCIVIYQAMRHGDRLIAADRAKKQKQPSEKETLQALLEKERVERRHAEQVAKGVLTVYHSRMTSPADVAALRELDERLRQGPAAADTARP